MRFLIGFTLSLALLISPGVQAQTSAPSHDSAGLTDGSERAVEMSDDSAATASDRPDEPKDPEKSEEAEEPEGFTRKGFHSQFGFGPGMLWLPDRTAIDDARHPAIALGFRTIFGASDQIGMELVTDILIHDFEAMGDAYGWYSEGDRDAKALKYGALWPGLIFIPFGASNYSFGFGVIGWTSPEVPAVFFDGGLQMLLYLRPSDPVHKIDFGGQLYVGAGLDFSELVGLSYRFSWAPPALLSLFQTYDEHIMQMSLLLTFSDWD